MTGNGAWNDAFRHWWPTFQPVGVLGARTSVFLDTPDFLVLSILC